MTDKGGGPGLLAFIRGDADASRLEEVGLRLTFTDVGFRVDQLARVEVVTPTRADIARGLLAGYAGWTDLKAWASVLLGATVIDLVALEILDEDPILEAIWAAAAGEKLSSTALSAAHKIS